MFVAGVCGRVGAEACGLSSDLRAWVLPPPPTEPPGGRWLQAARDPEINIPPAKVLLVLLAKRTELGGPKSSLPTANLQLSMPDARQGGSFAPHHCILPLS